MADFPKCSDGQKPDWWRATVPSILLVKSAGVVAANQLRSKKHVEQSRIDWFGSIFCPLTIKRKQFKPDNK